MSNKIYLVIDEKNKKEIYYSSDEKLRDNFYNQCREKKMNVIKGEKNIYNE